MIVFGQVVFLGQSGTGKTSLIRQFAYRTLPRDQPDYIEGLSNIGPLCRTFEPDYQATVGMDFVSKLVTLEANERKRS